MSSAAISLKRLRERANPRLTVRAMAEKLGVPLSSYSRYETPAKFKRSYLPMPLARQIARVLADHDIEPAEVMALAIDDISKAASPDLSVGEEQLLDHFRHLDPDQRALLLQLAEQMERRAGGPTGATLHDHARTRQSYRDSAGQEA